MSQIGTVELIAKIDTAQYKKGAAEIDNANKEIEGSSATAADNSSSAFLKVAKIGLAAVATAAVAVGAIIISNFDNAIKRVDTLNNSTRTFENMGFSAQAVDSAMKALDKSIRGLPTPLDEAVRGVQMISASTNDLPKSQKIFSALNNAIIGFGGSSADVSNAILQMSQAFAGGRIDAMTWNSMLNSNLGPALNAIARQMGVTTKSLKEGLSDGSISVEQFQQALIDMNEKGGGGMKSFALIAKDATSGISTGWANLNTAVTRGIASIIEAVGSPRISQAMTRFGDTLEGGLTSFGTTLAGLIPNILAVASQVGDYLDPKLTALWSTITTKLIPAISSFAQAFGPSAGQGLVGFIGLVIDELTLFLQIVSPVLQFLSDNTWIVWGLVGAFVAFKSALAISEAISAFQAGMAIANGAMLVTAGEAATTTGFVAGLKFALAGLLGPWQIVLAIIGAGAVIYAIKEVSEALDDLLNKWAKAGKAKVGNIEVDSNSSAGLTQRLMNAFSGFRAGGGPVSAGQAYIVGEKQPELFVPSTSGTIVPEVPSGSSMNITINLSGIMSRSRSDERDIAKSLVARINEELQAKHQPLIGGGAI